MPDITRAELVEAVRRFLAGDTDTEQYFRLFTTNVAHPALSDLIFHPSSDFADVSAEQIVDATRPPTPRPLRNRLAARPGWR